MRQGQFPNHSEAPGLRVSVPRPHRGQFLTSELSPAQHPLESVSDRPSSESLFLYEAIFKLELLACLFIPRQLPKLALETLML